MKTARTAPRAVASRTRGTAPLAPPKPDDLAKSRDALLLNHLPALVRAMTTAGTKAAVAFDYVHKNRLYLTSGYDAMLKYAEKELGFRGRSMFDFYSRAGEAVRRFYPDAYSALIEDIVGATDPESTKDPVEQAIALPAVTVLALIPKLMRAVPEGERPKVLSELATGRWTARDIARRAKAADSAGGPHRGGVDAPARPSSSPRPAPPVAAEATSGSSDFESEILPRAPVPAPLAGATRPNSAGSNGTWNRVDALRAPAPSTEDRTVLPSLVASLRDAHRTMAAHLEQLRHRAPQAAEDIEARDEVFGLLDALVTFAGRSRRRAHRAGRSVVERRRSRVDSDGRRCLVTTKRELAIVNCAGVAPGRHSLAGDARGTVRSLVARRQIPFIRLERRIVRSRRAELATRHAVPEDERPAAHDGRSTEGG
jgi:hypothetical protein